MISFMLLVVNNININSPCLLLLNYYLNVTFIKTLLIVNWFINFCISSLNSYVLYEAIILFSVFRYFKTDEVFSTILIYVLQLYLKRYKWINKSDYGTRIGKLRIKRDEKIASLELQIFLKKRNSFYMSFNPKYQICKQKNKVK